jgi:hypothetical protein
VVLNDVSVSGSQYWSLSRLSQRGFVSSGAGVDKGVPIGALNSLTITNFTDNSTKGSLVVDLVKHKCAYYKNEGGSGYQGYDLYHNTIAQAAAGGLPVTQTNHSSMVCNGQSYGPVELWAITPPTGDPDRVLKYTLVYKAGTNYLISYQTTGTEPLSNEKGVMEKVQMSQVELRTVYSVVNASSWDPGFFSPDQCPFPPASSPNSDNETLHVSQRGGGRARGFPPACTYGPSPAPAPQPTPAPFPPSFPCPMEGADYIGISAACGDACITGKEDIVVTYTPVRTDADGATTPPPGVTSACFYAPESNAATLNVTIQPATPLPHTKEVTEAMSKIEMPRATCIPTGITPVHGAVSTILPRGYSCTVTNIPWCSPQIDLDFEIVLDAGKTGKPYVLKMPCQYAPKVCKPTEYCCPDAKKCLTPTKTTCDPSATTTACGGSEICCPLTKLCVTAGPACVSPCVGTTSYCCPEALKCLTPTSPGTLPNTCPAGQFLCPLTSLCVTAGPVCSPP